MPRPIRPAVVLLATLACSHTSSSDSPAPTAGGAAARNAPAAPEAEPPARFVENIPRCQASENATSTHEVREKEPGAKVVVKGVLVHSPKWDCGVRAPDCTGNCCKACTTPWFVVDAKEASRPYMSRARLYLRAPGTPARLSLAAKECDVRSVNASVPPKPVVASGTFQGSAGEGGGSYLISDARLCTP